LLNDRLKVTVGSNFELEGPQQTNSQNSFADNVALDYMLSRDGRYLLRAYRKNEYEGELNGYVIETGLNFIMSFDYDHFHDLFRKKAKK
jgi:translocation and assembly module TamB